MRHPIPLAMIAVALTLAAAGCGSGATHTDPAPPRSAADTPSSAASPALLEQAVRRAIIEEHKLSVEVLWTNRVPANPPASGGPALASLRRSAAQRRRAGVRVRVLSEHFRIVAVQLNPSYTTATATVLDNERVQPTYPNGRPRGKAVTLNEHVRLDLRRVGNTEHFKVWKVVLLP